MKISLSLLLLSILLKFSASQSPMAVVGFDQMVYTVVEESSSDPLVVEVCVSLLSGQLVENTVVSVTTQSGTAMAGEDFETLNEELTFGNDLTSSQNPLSANHTDPQTKKCISLLVLNDAIAEKEEAFQLLLEPVGSDQSEVQILPGQATVFITDNDAILLDVVQTMFLLIEDTVNDTVPGELEFCLNTAQQLQREATVRVFTTQDGTAESGVDYVSINEELTIGSGADSNHTVNGASVCVRVQAIPDNIQESDESIRIRVTPVDGGAIIADGFLTVLLQDREPDNGEEGSCLARGFTDCCDDSTFFNSNCVAGDCCCDQGCFTRTLCPCCPDILQTLCPPVVPGIGVFGFTQSEIILLESESTTQVCVSLVNGSLWRSVTLTVTALSRSAIHLVDYVSPNITLQFHPPSSSNNLSPSDPAATQCLNMFSIVSDDIIEDDEEFYLQLLVQDPIHELFVSIPNNSSRVVIVDDDTAVLYLDETVLSVEEGDSNVETVALCVVLDNAFDGLEREIAINLTTIPGTADFSDFRPLINHTVLLSPVNRFRVCEDLAIQGDLDLEGEEEFEVEMTLVSNHLNSVRGESRARVVIYDNDGATVFFQKSSYTTVESDSVEVCVSLQAIAGGVLQKSLVVGLSSMDITTDDTDYFPLLSNVREMTFEPHAGGLPLRSQCVMFNAVDDSVLEGAEELSVELMVVSDMVQRVAPSVATVLILDNDGSIVALQSTTYTAREGDEVTTPVCVQLTSLSRNTLGTSLVVNLTTTDGTAMSGEDYAGLMSVELTFPAESQLGTLGCVGVSVTDDNIVEQPEEFSVRLESLTPAVASVDPRREMGTVTIISDTADTIGGVEPNITSPPQSTSLPLGGSVNLTCTAVGEPEVTHQWFMNGWELEGERGALLQLSGVDLEDRGCYSCKVENSLGVVMSPRAVLTIQDLFQFTFEVKEERLSAIFGEISRRLVPDHPIPNTNAFIHLIQADTYAAEFIVTVIAEGQESFITLAERVSEVFGSFLEPLGENVTMPVVQRYDRCAPESVTFMHPNSAIEVTIEWPEDSVGTVTVACPCGALTGVLGVYATRECLGMCAGNATWAEQDVSQCLDRYSTSLDLCRVSEMSVVDGASSLVSLTSRSQLRRSDLAVVLSTLEWLTTEAERSNQVDTIANDFYGVMDNLFSLGAGRLVPRRSRLMELLEKFGRAYLFTGSGNSRGFSQRNFATHIQDIAPDDISQATNWIFTADMNLAGTFLFSSGGRGEGGDISTVESSVASLIPTEVLQSSQTLSRQDSVRLVHTAYIRDSLFQGTSGHPNTISSYVLSVDIDTNASLTNLSHPVLFLFRKSLMDVLVPDTQQFTGNGTMAFHCVFWDSTLNGGTGDWSQEGCQVMNETQTTVVCQCNHLSSFTILTGPGTEVEEEEEEDADVNFIYVSFIGVLTCMVFLGVTLFGHLTSNNKKTERHGQIIINISVALLGLYIVYIVAAFKDFLPNAACAVFAVLLQYFVLVYLGWVGVEVVYLFMEAFRSSMRQSKTHRSLRNVVFGLVCVMIWVAPVIIFCATVAPDHENYYSRDKLCFPENESLYYGIALPSAIIYTILITLSVISLCYIVIMRRKHPESLTKRLALLLAVGLAIIFAVAWVLLTLSTSSGNLLSKGLEVAFLVIFTTLIGIHGVLIFLQWNAKPCFCPTKSNQEKPVEPSTLRRSLRHSTHSRRPRSDLPEGFNANVGWTFATEAQQEYREGAPEETVSLDSTCVFDDETPSTAVSSADNIPELCR